ncbi:effector-associated constant component EACC1 [Streptomyces avermitilis]|uniref:effector-associated constant component EACC1 n=1 Tax=Streptomyces avermitilis TaxID=33903 RepID=UPI0036900AAE
MVGMTQADTETPELELTVSGGDAETHLLALRDWLALEDTLRGRLELRGSAPEPGHMGRRIPSTSSVRSWPCSTSPATEAHAGPVDSRRKRLARRADRRAHIQFRGPCGDTGRAGQPHRFVEGPDRGAWSPPC